MKYFIDTSEQSEIDKWKDFVVGVTSNPALLYKVGITTSEFLNNNMSLFKNVFIQINSLQDIMNYRKNKTIFKVPLLITPEFNGYALLKQLIKDGRRACATIVYDIGQFNYACEVGSEFSVVLFAKNDNEFIVDECCDLKQRKGYETKVVAASFRSADDVFECINDGADYATIPPKIMEEVFSNKKAVNDYNEFYGENK